MKSKIQIIILVVVILFTPVSNIHAEDIPLVSNRRDLVNVIYRNMVKREEDIVIRFKGNISTDLEGGFNGIIDDVYNIDRKTTNDFDYLKNNVQTCNYGYKGTYEESVITIKVVYRETKEQMKVVNREVKKALKKLSLKGKNQYQKIKAIHDYIVNMVNYDTTYRKYTAYDAIINKSCVCQGYALLTYKMMLEEKIPCRYITGVANGGPHAWNIVKLNGKWYHLDTTFDDPISSRPILSHKYFLIGSETIKKDHTMDAEFNTSVFQDKYPISTEDYR